MPTVVPHVPGGQGVVAPEDRTDLEEVRLERRAIVNGWLTDGKFGVNTEKMRKVADRTYLRIMQTQDDRALAALGRNYIAIVAQIQRQEQIDRGEGGEGAQVNLNLQINNLSTELEKASDEQLAALEAKLDRILANVGVSDT